MTQRTKGFTLIELLVVVAIIGILSSVVLVMVTDARNRGANNAIKNQLTEIRTEAGLIFTTTGAYTGICNDTKIIQASNAASRAGGAAVSCVSDTRSWSVVAPLKAPESGYVSFCVDHNANATLSASTTATVGATCR